MTGETRMSIADAGGREIYGANCTSSGGVFKKMEAATGNERRPVSAVDRRYDGMCSCSVNDDRRERRPGRLERVKVKVKAVISS